MMNRVGFITFLMTVGLAIGSAGADSFSFGGDQLIKKRDLENTIFKMVAGAKKRVLLKNYPSLNTQDSNNRPNLLLSLLGRASDKGVDIKILHKARRGTYLLTKNLILRGVTNIEQLESDYNYGVISSKASYAIIDNVVLIISEPDDDPRILGWQNNIDEVKEDFRYTWEYTLKEKHDPFRD